MTFNSLISGAGNFFIPRKLPHSAKFSSFNPQIIAIIPTYKPPWNTLSLIRNLLDWEQNIQIVIVNDCSPDSQTSNQIYFEIQQFSKKDSRVHLIKTPENRFKAGAVDFGYEHIPNLKESPDFVLVFDDDVVITKSTVPNLLSSLESSDKLGAVCSLALVKNKNKNLLTRIQALEYHNFNLSRLADHGFFKGPLIMHGMLSAFRYEALRSVDGYTVGHILEDYDLTVRLKKNGWHSGLAFNAQAWTNVPESFSELWKQRVRWNLGGLGVIRDYWRHPVTWIQDLIGHAYFLLVLILVILSFFVRSTETEHTPGLITLLILVSLFQFLISYLFSLLSLRWFKNGQVADYLIRALLLPEFIYYQLLSFMLVGCYLFYLYSKLGSKLVQHFKFVTPSFKLGLFVFKKIGYAVQWGTREN